MSHIKRHNGFEGIVLSGMVPARKDNDRRARMRIQDAEDTFDMKVHEA